MSRWKVATASEEFAPKPAYPGVSPRATSGGATHAIWHDPSSFDPLTQGPPYLPTPAPIRIASQENLHPLVSVLIALRGLAALHQTHHWLASGRSFYGDHEMFDRLYNGIVPEIDQVAERAVQTAASKPELLSPFQMQKASEFVARFSTDVSEQYGAASLAAESAFLQLLQPVAGKLEELMLLSLGVENLLGALADKHEEHVYLLTQRVQDRWKTKG